MRGVFRMSASREILDEDVCASCANACLLRPPRGYSGFRSPEQGGPWSAPALCVRGWPIKAADIFMNIVCGCPSYERRQKERACA